MQSDPGVVEFLQARAPGRSVSSRAAGVADRPLGPYDSEEPIAQRLGQRSGRVDFGSLRVPIPARAQLQVEEGAGDLLRAVHVLVPSGRVSLSALAAPRSNPLWRGLASEIADSLAKDGARVHTEWGEWGREVQAGSKGALSRFIGVDGSRWMLYGVATGPDDGAVELAEVLREMIRGTVVHRGPDPLPVRTVLPLWLPEHLEENVVRARKASAREPRKSTSGKRPAGSPDGGSPARTPSVPRRATAPAMGSPVPTPPPGYPARPMDSPAPVAPPPSAPGALPAVAQLPPPSGAAIGSLGADRRPGHPAGLPPVPGQSAAGGPRRSVESTWSSANPVVSADQMAQQPAWAQLAEAPSFWPDERYRPADGGPLDPDASGPSLGLDITAPLDRGALDLPAPAGLPDSWPSNGGHTGMDAWSDGWSSNGAHSNGDLNGHRDVEQDGDWSGDNGDLSSGDLLSGTDAFRAVLTLDAAATRDWEACAERRGRHRRRRED